MKNPVAKFVFKYNKPKVEKNKKKIIDRSKNKIKVTSTYRGESPIFLPCF